MLARTAVTAASVTATSAPADRLRSRLRRRAAADQRKLGDTLKRVVPRVPERCSSLFRKVAEDELAAWKTRVAQLESLVGILDDIAREDLVEALPEVAALTVWNSDDDDSSGSPGASVVVDWNDGIETLIEDPTQDPPTQETRPTQEAPAIRDPVIFKEDAELEARD